MQRSSMSYVDLFLLESRQGGDPGSNCLLERKPEEVNQVPRKDEGLETFTNAQVQPRVLKELEEPNKNLLFSILLFCFVLFESFVLKKMDC